MVNILAVLTSDRPIHEIVSIFQREFTAVLQEALTRKARAWGDLLPPLAREALAGERPFSLERFILRGGKRLRPLLFCCGYLCLGGTNARAIFEASIAVELLQAGLIIHDDVIDRSCERRGGPTMHRLWEEYFHHDARYRPRYSEEAEHFGISMAMLMGDIASSLAYEILAHADFPFEARLRAVHTFSDVICRVAFGELLDVNLGMRPLETLTEEEIIKVYELKTAGYTTEGPLHMGAVLGGAHPQQLGLLSAYAVPLGVAFQIQDDLLGMFGSREAIGKDEGADLLEAKRTPLLLEAFRKSSSEERALLQAVLQDPQRAKDALERVRQILVSSGAVLHAQELIAQNFVKVYESLLPIEKEFGATAARVLRAIASYIGDRQDYKGALQSYGSDARGC